MKKLAIVLVLAAVVSSLSAAHISGIVYNSSSPDYIISDIYGNHAEIKLDENGKFNFNLNVENPEYYMLSKEKNSWKFPLHPNDSIFIRIDASQPQYFLSISGSDDVKTLEKGLDAILLLLQKIKTLPQAGKEVFINEFIDKVYGICNENPRSLSNLLLLDMIQLTATHEPDYVKVVEQLKAFYPANKYVEQHAARAQDIKKFAIGSVVSDIQLPDVKGKVVKLRSLKSSYILVDFWAAWCGPCRMENPHLVKAYNTYKEKGFEIYGVSLDNNADAWNNAIQKDGITWIQVSDLKGWGSPVAQAFGIKSIPQNLLIDKNGKIVAKNLRGEELEKKLQELFN